MKLTIRHFQIDNIGPDVPSYFPGVGAAYTEWDAVQLGVGDTAAEAYADALDQLWTRYDASKLPKHPRGIRQTDRVQTLNDGDDCAETEQWYQWYVAIFYKEPSEC